jgi:hypothetical protein
VLGDELERQGVAAGGGAVGGAVVGALELALGGAVGRRAAGVGPLVAIVAVLVVGVVQPAPVGINDDLGVDGRAGSSAGALLPCDLGVRLGLLLADLLSGGQAHQGQSRREILEILLHLHGDKELDKCGSVWTDNGLLSCAERCLGVGHRKGALPSLYSSRRVQDEGAAGAGSGPSRCGKHAQHGQWKTEPTFHTTGPLAGN